MGTPAAWYFHACVCRVEDVFRDDPGAQLSLHDLARRATISNHLCASVATALVNRGILVTDHDKLMLRGSERAAVRRRTA